MESPAAKASSAFQQVIDTLMLGGPVVLILVAMSVVGVTIAVLKIWQFWSLRVFSLANVRCAAGLYRAGQPLEALICVQGDRSPVAQTMTHAIRGAMREDIDGDEVREEVARFGTSRMHALRAYLRPIEVIASLAPLLGLFGTVLGMIEAFRKMESAGNQVNPAVLSGGIWEALLTTAVGLAVAIPMVAILTWLERVVERTEFETEDAVTRVFARDLAVSVPGAVDARHQLARQLVGAE